MPRSRKPSVEPEPLGPFGVPVDAPDNTAPGISPIAVSRMHRAEDDAAAIAHSPDFSDGAPKIRDDRQSAAQWIPGISPAKPVRAVLLDIDGTLIDSNDAHAEAWVRAFEEHGVHVDPQVVRRAIGMGGDQLMPQVSGIEESSSHGRPIAQRRREIFWNELLTGVKPLPRAAELVRRLKERGLTIVAATSASKEELTRLLQIAGVEDLFDGGTSADHVAASKPEPDIIVDAVTRAGVHADEAIMIGDTPYDVDASVEAGVRVIAFRSGGWDDADLRGAIAIYDGPADLLAQLDASPLGPLPGHVQA